ncbi:MAG: UPF0057 membrane protein YqaE, partial [uncultured Chloroflexia bacterium]
WTCCVSYSRYFSRPWVCFCRWGSASNSGSTSCSPSSATSPASSTRCGSSRSI